jgi:hypothetical protein
MPEVVVGRDEEDLRKYGATGTAVLGRHIVGSGEETHLTTPLYLDMLRPHVIVVTGKRGEGKSYTMSVIVEEMFKLPDDIRENLCSLMIDTQGIFWTMKTPSEKDIQLLNEWKMKPRGFPVEVYVPEGQTKTFTDAGVDFDGAFSIQPSQLSVEEWLSVFNIDQNETLGILLHKVMTRMRNKKQYSLDDIISAINSEKDFQQNDKLALQNRFVAAKDWGVFGDEKMPDILVGGKTTVIDVSLTPQNVRSLLVALACKQVFNERVKARRKEELGEMELSAAKRVPMPWIFIDEAHNFMPDVGRTVSLDILSTLVREGRQPGITLVFATQRPEKLHPDALAQADMVIAHRLTAKADVDALKAIMQTYLLYDLGKYINELPKLKGVAIILDDNSERIYRIRVRPKQSWHAGASPVAI